MSILTIADQPTFFPEVNLSGDALMGAIAAAQALAESPQGSNRPVERQLYVETLSLGGGLCYLKARPKLTEISTVKIRATSIARFDSWQRRTPAYANGAISTPWHIVTDYELDEATGEIAIAAIGGQGTPLSQSASLSVRVEYYLGLDFGALFPSPKVLALKSALAGILKASLIRSAGLESFSLTDFYRVDFGNEAESGLQEHLQVFKAIGGV